MRESVMNRLIEYLDILEANEAISGTVLIKYRGDTVLHKGYGWADREEMIPNQPETKFLIGSISKQFTAMAILQLWENNRLALEDTINRYFPRFPYSNRITLHDLLTHQSGILNFIFHKQFASLSQQSIKLDELINVISELPFVFEPKSRFEYTNSGYALLASVVEQVSGYPFADYLNQYIFAPLGMKDTGYFEPDQMISNRAKGYSLRGDKLVPSKLHHPSWFQGSGSLT